MSQARTVRVTFTRIMFPLTVTPVPTNGFVTASGISCGAGGTGDCIESYASGTMVTLTGNPATGFQVGTWTGCTPSGNNTQCTVLMSQARTVTVTFTAVTFPLTVSPVRVEFEGDESLINYISEFESIRSLRRFFLERGGATFEVLKAA